MFMMNIITWNCRGTGRKSFPGLVRDLRDKYDANFMILLVTHVSGIKAQEIIRRIGFDGSFVFEA